MRNVQFTDEWRGGGEVLARVDGGGLDGKAALMDSLAGAFGLPDWFGRNWDALEESLRGLKDGDRVVVIENATALWRDHPRLAGTLVEVWLDAAPAGLQLVFSW